MGVNQAPIYQLSADKFLFRPGSTTKLLTVGTVLELLGADHPFRTRVYRTGSRARPAPVAPQLVPASVLINVRHKGMS